MGSELLMGQGLVSADHRWLATFRPDGWFMVYDMDNEEVVFESENGRAGVTCTYNDDGSLGVYGAGGRAVWHSRTTHDSPLMLVMGINGLLQGYADDNSVYYEVGTDESVDTDAGNVAVLGAQELKDVSSKWTLTLHGSTETFLLYFCALLVLVNVSADRCTATASAPRCRTRWCPWMEPRRRSRRASWRTMRNFWSKLWRSNPVETVWSQG